MNHLKNLKSFIKSSLINIKSHKLMVFTLGIFLFFSIYTLMLKEKEFKDPAKLLAEAQAKPEKIYIDQYYFDHLGEGFLGDLYQRYKNQLENQVTLLGANTRPDLKNNIFFFSIEGKNIQVNENEILEFLDFGIEDEEASKFKLKVSGDSKEATISILDQMTLKEISFAKLALCEKAPKLELGRFKLDPHLLLRMQAKWIGVDQFIKEYAQDQYSQIYNKERITFAYDGLDYSCYVKAKDFLIFKNNQWQEACENSSSYPLLEVSKIENNIMYLELWDKSGLNKESFALSLLKPNLNTSKLTPLNFVGVKSKSKWLLKDRLNRLEVEKGDWLLHIDNQWRKLNQSDLLELYVTHLNLGELFVVKELLVRKNHKAIVGDLIDPTRSRLESVEIDITHPKK